MNTVTFIPREVARTLPPQENTILISINNPGEEHLPFPGWDYVLWLTFDDITTPIPGHKPFDLDMAQSVVRFVGGDTSNVVVHCQAGMSRSAAVAKFISDHFGHTLTFHKDGIWTSQFYNRFVYDALKAEVGEDMASYYRSLEQSAFLNGEEL